MIETDAEQYDGRWFQQQRLQRQRLLRAPSVASVPASFLAGQPARLGSPAHNVIVRRSDVTTAAAAAAAAEDAERDSESQARHGTTTDRQTGQTGRPAGRSSH